jgi:curli biogenesis system outer membrane secretion channel CsgG
MNREISMRFMALIATVALAAPSAVLAQDAAPAPAEAAKPEKPVCKVTSTTGSRLRKTRYCMTKWEAQLQAQKSQRDLDSMRRTDTATQPPAGFN